MADADLNPLVSICIPVFNGGSFIYRAIESCIHQSYKNIEIIVVDNASTDDTKKVVMAYAARDRRITYFANDKNIGPVRNWLRTFQLASAEFVQPLGHDDWLSRNHTEEAVRQILKHPGTAGVLSRVIALNVIPEERFTLNCEVAFKSGNYSTRYLTRQLYRSQWGAVGFLSLMRRTDLLENLTPFASNNSSPTGALMPLEAMVDWLVYLRILAKYNFATFTGESAYVKISHRENIGKQINYDLASPLEVLRYYDMFRRGLEHVYSERSGNHLASFRTYVGVECMNTLALSFLRRRFQKSESTLNLVGSIKEFFKDYSYRQRLSVLLALPAASVTRLAKFMVRKLRKTKPLTASSDLFLNGDLTFES